MGWSAPDWVIAPVSRGDGLAGVWRGLVELHQLGLVRTLPRMGAVERYPSLSTALEGDLPLPHEVQGVEPTAAVPRLAGSASTPRAPLHGRAVARARDGRPSCGRPSHVCRA